MVIGQGVFQRFLHDVEVESREIGSGALDWKEGLRVDQLHRPAVAKYAIVAFADRMEVGE